MTRRAIVIGGSIGGLFAAAMLRCKGWEVDVYERTGVELSGRGAGIVTHAELIDALELCGAGTRELGVHINRRTGFDLEGNVIREFEFPQIVTSWDRLHTLLRAIIPNDHHHLDHCFKCYENLQDGVRVHFTDGQAIEADLLVGADGFRSAVRGQMHPHVKPEYAGYVVWRGVAEEADLPPELKPEVFETFGFYLPEQNEIIGYPIAGKNNLLEPGKRRYNWVWYRVVDQDKLADMLTDEGGTHHDISIPPPLIRRDVIKSLRDDAESLLSPPFRKILREVQAPFFTPIYDHASPSMVNGRVVLVGDAAFVARPHVGMGVTKAAVDARVLAEALEDSGEDVSKGLAAFNAERVEKSRIAYERARFLGEYLMPRYKSEEEKNTWTQTHNIDSVMRETAVADFY